MAASSNPRHIPPASFYRTNRAYRSSAALSDPQAAEQYYRRYVTFVRTHLPAGAALLEVGAATGLSAVSLSRAGYSTTAVDVCEQFFAAGLEEHRPRFVGGDALRLPFADESFDGVTSLQTLEHVSDPAAALGEMARVLRPGGWLVVVGPNLISLLTSIFVLIYSIPRTRPVRYWLTREPGSPRFPFGSTYPEALSVMMTNLRLLVRKQRLREAEFTMREPDFSEPAGADSDSCYLLNPIDIVRHLSTQGFEIVSRRGKGPLGMFGALAGGTWVAARKR